MLIGLGNTIPNIANLPGQGSGGGGGIPSQVDNLYSFEFNRPDVSQFRVTDFGLGSATSFSISFWANLNATNVDGPVLARWGSQKPRILFYFQANASWRLLFENTTGGLKALTSGIPHTPGTWQFIVFTYDGTTVRSYQNNGIAGSTANAPGFVWPTFDYLNIGNDDSSPNRQLGGFIDELAFYNYKLEVSDIQTIYGLTETGKTANLNALPTPPLVWYRMGD